MSAKELIERVAQGESPSSVLNEVSKADTIANVRGNTGPGDKFRVVTTLRTSAGKQPSGMKFEITKGHAGTDNYTIKFLVGSGSALVDGNTLVNAIAKGAVKRI